MITPPGLVIDDLLKNASTFFRALVIAYILAVNIVTLLVYRHDKNAARDAEWRLSEMTLHFWGLVGGWPAAFVAQRVLRHKINKLRYLVVFWAIVGIEECLCLKILGIL